jgi:predicted DsbA family dithiol-disulfide isomerase
MPDTAEPLVIDVVSDVVCPWCFVGKRRLEKAIASRPDIPVEVRFRPYFLNDWVPREGISRTEYLTTKFGSVERYNANAQRIVGVAAGEGLTYAPDKIKRQPNTIDCHRLIYWAEQAGNGPRMKQRLMSLYFTEGADLTDREVLVKAAADCGLDADRTRELLASETDVDTVTQAAESAKEAGIEGVPMFIFGGMLAVSGAQSPEYLVSAMEKAIAEREKRGAAVATV